MHTAHFTYSRPTPFSLTSGVTTDQSLHDSAISDHSTTNILHYTETESIGHGTEPSETMSGHGAAPSSNVPHHSMTNPRKGQGHQPMSDPANDMYDRLPHSICHNCMNTFRDNRSHSFPSDKVDQHLIEVHKDDRDRAKNAETSVQCGLQEQLKELKEENRELKAKVEVMNEELKQAFKQRIADTIANQQKKLDERERIMEERERNIQQRERMAEGRAEEREQQMEGGNPQQNIDDKENGPLKAKEIVIVETLTPNTQ